MVADIQADGGRAAAFGADLMSETETVSLVRRACDTLGRVTCLINNASLFERDEPLTVTRESWERHMQVNLRAPFLLTQTVARQMPPAASGCIINIIDQRVLESDAALHELYSEQGRPVDADEDAGPGAGASGAGQCRRTGADAAELAADRRAIRAAMVEDAAGASGRAGGNFRGGALPA